MPIGVAMKKRKRLNDNGNGGMKLRAHPVQELPLFSCLLMKRIIGERKRDPCTAVDENRLPVPHHGSS